MRMNKRFIIVSVVFLALLATTGFVFISKRTKKSETVGIDELVTAIQKTEEAAGNVPKETRVFSEEERGKWNNEIYKDPFVRHIRVVLNGYLSGTNEGMDSPELVINPLGSNETSVSGLSSFNKDYYKSKFIVLTVAGFIGGGKQINILFQDQPDKIFWVWVYHAPETDHYDMRGFAENVNFSQEFIQNFQKNNSEMLKDKEHAL